MACYSLGSPLLCPVEATEEDTYMTVADPRLPDYRGFDPSDSIVAVKVGNPSVTFAVHRTLLSSSSEFFKTKAKPEWACGGAVVELPEEESPTAFSIYAKWLYTRGIITTNSGVDNSEQHQDEFKALAEAYVLGESLMDTTFQDVIIDALRAKIRSSMGGMMWPVVMELVKTIYNGTPEGSKGRSLLVDIFQYHAGSDVFGTYHEDIPREFLFDTVQATADRRPSLPLTRLGGTAPTTCGYHCHGEDGKCYLAEKTG